MTTVYVIETEVERDGEDYPIALAIFSTWDKANEALPVFKERNKYSLVSIVERPLDPPIAVKSSHSLSIPEGASDSEIISMIAEMWEAS